MKWLVRRRSRPAKTDVSIVVDGARKVTGGKQKNRVAMTIAVFFGIYAIIAGRLVYFGLQDPDQGSGPASRVTASRPDIVDRNGEVLATDIKHRIALRRAAQASSMPTRPIEKLPPCCRTSTSRGRPTTS
jgi:cell division protein FtsI (penicillin-binding protein 3)